MFVVCDHTEQLELTSAGTHVSVPTLGLHYGIVIPEEHPPAFAVFGQAIQVAM
jgi:hypothetical protein